MKVLLVSTNRLSPSETQQWVPVEPLGLTYVASGVRSAGHDVSFLDLCFARDPAAAVRAAVRECDPDAIGLSFRNIEMMAYFNNASFLDDLLAAVAACREASDAPVILGGSGFSVMPAEIMKRSGADIGVIGEGERSFPRVLAALERGDAVAGIPGVALVEDGELRLEPCAHSPDLSDLPPPDRDLIDHGRYLAAGGRMNIQTRRGCPFGCTYCTYPLVEGPRVRCRPARDVAAELRLMHERFGVEEVYIVDSQFNHPIDHAKAVCAEFLAMRD